MIVRPRMRGFICTTAHPEGLKRLVLDEIEYVKSQPKLEGPKNVFIIGASSGYGLASRIAAAYGANANTIGVFFEKEGSDTRTATAGWYNTAAFEKFAHLDGLYAKSINGDAFSQAIKEKTAELIASDLGKIDLVIYSLASPRRVHPLTGTTYVSTIKPIGQAFHGKTIDLDRGEIRETSIEPATDEEINNTIKVMGGEDWEMWIKYLADKHLLAEGVKTVSYSYLGPVLTHAIYKDGTIGAAKKDLKMTEKRINALLRPLHGRAFVSVNKAVVTQASVAIPVVAIYTSILFKLMKEAGTDEGCIEQIYRLYKDYIYTDQPKALDKEGYIRLDDLEMDETIQQKIEALWGTITSDNIWTKTDFEGYKNEFHHLFGFNVPGVDYEKDVDPNVPIDSIK